VRVHDRERRIGEPCAGVLHATPSPRARG
jgi:hypothetical protein